MKASLAIVSAVLVLSPALAFAADQAIAFPDVATGSPYADAVRWAAEAGVFKGMPDGLFHPDEAVDRATALTLLVRLSGKEVAVVGSGSTFADIAADAWYRSAAETGVAWKIVDGPPKRASFEPSRVVTREEFLKMLAVSESRVIASLPYTKEASLSADTDFPELWSAGYLRDAYARAVIDADDNGLLSPAHPLTRGEIAVLLWRNDRAANGQQLQAVVTAAESEIRRFFALVEKKDFAKAGYAVTRLRALSEAAVAADPDSSVTVGIGKVTNAFGFLRAAQQAGIRKSMADVTGNVEKAKSVAAEFPTEKPFVDLGKRVAALADALASQAAALTR